MLENPDRPSPQLVAWKEHIIPPSIKQALEAPYRGERFGENMKWVLDTFYIESAVLERTMTPMEEATPKTHVKTSLQLKADPAARPNILGYHAINPSKLVDKLLKVKKIDDKVSRLARLGFKPSGNPV